MTPRPSWDRLEELFERVAAVPPEGRKAWLDEHCDDPTLRSELESLLAAQAGARTFVDRLSHGLVGGGAEELMRDPEAASETGRETSVARGLLDGSTSSKNRRARLTAALADRYAIEREIGSGGMATVYLARDLKHRRKVAVKVIRPELAAVLGTERFLKEIEVTAKLQHPHILPLFDSSTIDGLPYYVMPFVEGESLEQRLVREKQLPIDEALSISVAVCSALEYAHEQDVIHRDIKPANILLQGGHPLVADFGIALAVTAAGGQRLTETGLSIGTPEYMSPEQASGTERVDQRTDQYALACVVYQMLVGEPPHTGPSVPAIIAKVMTEAPRRIRAARETVPPHVELAVHRALSKLPADRHSSVGQFAEALVNPSASRQWLGFVQLTGTSWRRLATHVAVAALVVLAVIPWIIREPRTAPAATVRFSIPYPTGESFGTMRHALAMSPDGSTIAYSGQGDRVEQLYLHRIDQLESRMLPGTDGALDPFFSPDGASVGYATVVGLYRLPVTGGPPIKIADFPEPRGPNWGTDGMIRFGSTGGLWQVSAEGGRPEQLTTLDSARGDLMHSRPQLLPESGALLFTITEGDLAETRVAVLQPRSGEIIRLFPGISARYSSTGHIIYGRSDGMLMGVPFDAGRLEVTGPADTLISGVTVKEAGSIDFALSRTGSLVYLTGSINVGTLALVDRTGLTSSISVPGSYVAPTFSPDGGAVLVGRGSPPTRQVWVLDLETQAISPVTFEGHNYYPIWSPDGSRIAFATETATGSGVASGVRLKASDGSGTAQTLVPADSGFFYYPESWSPDGQYIVMRRQETTGGETNRDLWIVRADGNEPPRQLFDLRSSLEDAARISPDGNWLAFSSDIAGEYEIFVTRFPVPGPRYQVSQGGGTEPAWSREGRELFYRDGSDMFAARFETTPTFRVLERAVLFSGRFVNWSYHTNYDVRADGRFVMVTGWATGGFESLVIVVNWFNELGRLTSP